MPVLTPGSRGGACGSILNYVFEIHGWKLFCLPIEQPPDLTGPN